MAILIQQLNDGYSLQYEPRAKEFCIIKESNYVMTAETQDKLEQKFDRYIKAMTSSNCPVKVITSNGMEEVTITSFNTESEKVWITKKDGKGQYPLNNYSNKPQFFELTETNKTSIAKYQDIQYQINKLNTEARVLETKLEKPITPEYFSKK
jgi:hypothetical protein